ncbi:MAG: carboxypeptidase-like regulatory domain-containing protein [bacterium]
MRFNRRFKKQENKVTGAGEPLFTLTGRVFDIDNGRPVKNAVVKIEALNLVDTVDAGGVYFFSNLKAGMRNLLLTALNYAATNKAVALQYDNLNVTQDAQMVKALGIALEAELPFEDPSGIWVENTDIFVTRYTRIGGFIHKMDEAMNILQTSARISTLTSDQCVASRDTCFWKDDSCHSFIDPDHHFEPDSISVHAKYAHCEQRLYGLVRINDYFYTSDGIGHYGFVSGIYIPYTDHHFFRLDPSTLTMLEVLTIKDSFDRGVLNLITDLAYDGQAIWLCNKVRNTFPKIRFDNFTAQSLFASPVSMPSGLAWDGHYLWIMAGNQLYQVHRDLTVRNRYVFSGFPLDQIAWDGKYMWAIRASTHHIYKLALPFGDHL